MDDPLLAFLRARLDEWGAAAKAMKAVYPTPWDVSDRGWMAHVVADEPNFADVIRLEQNHAPVAGWLGDVIQHVALNNPDFVLDDVAAKRRIVEQYELAGGGLTGEILRNCLDTPIRLLALPHAGHPDYDESWRP